MFDKRLIQELSDALPYIIKQVCCQWFSLICNMILTLSLCYMFVSFINHTLILEQIMRIMILLCITFIIRGICLKRQSHYAYLSASQTKRTLRTRLFDKIMVIGSHYQDYVATSELVQLSVEGINQLETYVSLYLPQLFYSVLAPVTLFIVTLFFDIRCAIVLLIFVPLIPISIVLVQKFAKKLLAKYWTSYTTLGDGFLENLQGLTTLKIYGSDAYKQQQMNIEAENFRKVTMRVLIMQLNSISVMDIVAYGGAAIGSFFALLGYYEGSISLFGSMFIIMMSFEYFIPMRQLGSYFHVAMNGMAASEKIFKLIDIEIDDHAHHKLKEEPMTIDIQHLDFSYDNDRQILKDISLSITKGFTGIVGESGSGKSTLAKLIMGYYQSRNLYIQNIERNQLDDCDFMQHFVYVTHDPMIFKGKLRDNLDCLNQYSDDMLWEALEKVKLAGYFQNQQGLSSEILESGNNLSGGQKQRINLARALLYNGDVYIFDEATSNIDVESEEAILAVINKMVESKKVILITHRLSSVKQCDEIFVLDKGRLVESGNHASLRQLHGLYDQLFKQQEALEVYQS
ncbi:MAG: ABC transporter ATP-binding protein/permease [Erysipelotrichaceae bacterium]|nr:ABC transporter ATP-binding protein/permease [Erysipelotrichaceae bacterium]